MKSRDSCVITLRGKRRMRMSKDLHIEYATTDSLDANREATLAWAEALRVCVNRAQTSP